MSWAWQVALYGCAAIVVVLGGLLGWIWRSYTRQQQACARLMEKVTLLTVAGQSQQIDTRAESPALQRLGDAINALAAERDRWRDSVQAQVDQASQSIQQERNRLAALMSALASMPSVWKVTS